MVGALGRLAGIGNAPLQRRAVDMRAMARNTWELVCAANTTRAVGFKLETLPEAQADPQLVMQIWQNLLDNAFKYTGNVQAAKVSVDSFLDAGRTWYRVTDNGAGFDMARAGQLFLPFQRMHSSKQFEGTGIGLSLVRRIVDLHGGDIRLRSASGVGTVAEFTLEPLPVPAG